MEDLRMKEMEHSYYTTEFDKVFKSKSEYPRNIQIRDNGNSTKWVSLNDESVKLLIKYLKENYNCE